jgi:large subunit ribosomal protein L9
MKVILLDEIKGKGREGDVVEVARGYAVNFLLPRKLAVEATSGNIKQLEARRTNIEKREVGRRTDAESVAARLDGKRVTIEANSGEGGRLFGSVTGPMIEEAVLAQLDVDIDRRKMDVHGHIKTLGEHPVEVRLHQDVHAEVIVVVVPSGETVAPMPVAEIIAAADAAEAAETEAEEAVPVDEAVAVEEALEEVAEAGEDASAI